MGPANVENGRGDGWRQALCRQWWIGIIVAWLMAGCGPPSNPLQSSVGLRPIPPWHEHEYVRMADSLQPTLQWETFPRQGDFKPDKTGRLPSVGNVAYELRIWTGDRFGVGEPVYWRNKLTTPTHQVEVPLAPHTSYIWMVRAWFELNGRPRVTEWSVLYPLGAENHDGRKEWYRSRSNCYSFFTPGK